MSDSEILVRVDGVSKKFCRSLKKSLWYGVQDIAHELNPFSRNAEILKSEKLKSADSGPISECQRVSVSAFQDAASDEDLREGEFYAVRDVSFTLRRGECLGLIGRNGAGKTTLLKMLNGLIKPDHGRIEMRGRVGALIALGAGFNPILTGRENIYVNGSVLGLTKREIEAKIEEIIDFADVRNAIDSPVLSYSSGMQVRLGFAVATALEPDVLLLDEVLAVGDGAFRYKCYRKIDEVRKNAAVIFVSHDMPSIARISGKALVMFDGKCTFIGETAVGIQVYSHLNEQEQGDEVGKLEVYPPLTQFEIGPLPTEHHYSTPLIANLMVYSDKVVGDVVLRVNIFNTAGAYVASCVIDSSGEIGYVGKGETRWNIELSSLPLRCGRYYLSFGVTDHCGALLAVSHKRHVVSITGAHPGTVAECQLIVNSFRRS